MKKLTAGQTWTLAITEGINPCECGGSAELVRSYRDMMFTVRCTKCGRRTVPCYLAEAATRYWTEKTPGRLLN